MKKVTKLLYFDGHITKQQTYSSIMKRLNVALNYEKQGLHNISQKKLERTLGYITNQNLRDPQRVDDYGYEVLKDGIEYLIIS